MVLEKVPTFQEVKDWAASKTTVNNHINDTSNPHNVSLPTSTNTATAYGGYKTAYDNSINVGPDGSNKKTIAIDEYTDEVEMTLDLNEWSTWTGYTIHDDNGNVIKSGSPYKSDTVATVTATFNAELAASVDINISNNNASYDQNTRTTVKSINIIVPEHSHNI